MRALLMGDAHIGRTVRGRSRLGEHRRILASFLGAVDDHDVDVCVLPGDTFDSARPGPDELQVFAEFIRGLIDREVQIIITPGNHDGPTTLRSMEGKVTSWLGAFPLERVHALSDPSFLVVGGYGYYTLPYPHKRSMDQLVERSLRDRTEEVSRALENIIETEHERLSAEHPGLPLIFVGHLSVLNAQLSADQAMRLGWDVTIRREVLEPFHAAFLGHIHRQQEVIGGHSWYSGSPLYGDFGETTQTKGFLLWEDNVPPGGWPLDGPPVPLLQRFTPVESDHLTMTRWDLYESNGWELDDWPGTDGYVQVRLFPDQGGTPSWSLKRQIKAAFTDAAGVWVDVMPRPATSRVRLDPAVRTTDPDAVLRSYIRLNGIPEQPTLDVARSIMAAVDEA
jgi:exonuclease SbcD